MTLRHILWIMPVICIFLPSSIQADFTLAPTTAYVQTAQHFSYTDSIQELMQKAKTEFREKKEANDLKAKNYVQNHKNDTAKLIQGFGLEDGNFIEVISEVLAQKGEPVVPKLIKALTDKNQHIRTGAVTTLGLLKSPVAIHPLTEHLKKEQLSEIRATLVESLAEIATNPLLDDPDTTGRPSSATGQKKARDTTELSSNSANIASAILSALEDDDSDVRRSAAKAMIIINCESIRPQLSAFLKDEDVIVSEAIAEALGYADTKKFIKELHPALGNNQLPTSPAPQKLKFKVLREEPVDSPIKAQVVIHAQVFGNVTKQGLLNLLDELHENVKKRTGFRYHPHPTMIGIYLYLSPEHEASGMGQWVAMLFKGPAQQKPDIRINETQISILTLPKETRFGYDEDARVPIFQSYILAERRASLDQERKYPDPPLQKYKHLTPEQQQRRQEEASAFYDEMKLEYKRLMAKQYGLKMWQFEQIATEGIRKQWPFPPSDD